MGASAPNPPPISPNTTPFLLSLFNQAFSKSCLCSLCTLFHFMVLSSVHCSETSALIFSLFLPLTMMTVAVLLLHPVHTSQSLLYGVSLIAVHCLSFFSFQGLTSLLTIPTSSFISSSSFSFSSSSLNVGILHCFIFTLLLFSIYPVFPRTSQSPIATAVTISLNQTFYQTMIDTSNSRCMILNPSSPSFPIPDHSLVFPLGK